MAVDAVKGPMMRTSSPYPWHIPERAAAYDCMRCGQSWPCEPARARLLALPRVPGALGARMAGELVQAMEVLPPGPPGALYQRFLGWIRPGRGVP